MKDISKRAKDALKRIGQESAINAHRVKTYGIELNGIDSQNETAAS